jgi:hypothetical protein
VVSETSVQYLKEKPNRRKEGETIDTKKVEIVFRSTKPNKDNSNKLMSKDPQRSPCILASLPYLQPGPSSRHASRSLG